MFESNDNGLCICNVYVAKVLKISEGNKLFYILFAALRLSSVQSNAHINTIHHGEISK